MQRLSISFVLTIFLTRDVSSQTLCTTSISTLKDECGSRCEYCVDNFEAIAELSESEYASYSSVKGFADTVTGANCQHASHESLSNVMLDCDFIDVCFFRVFNCAYDAGCRDCIDRGSIAPTCGHNMSSLVAACYEPQAICPEAEFQDNMLVIASMIVGSISIIATLIILLHIFGYGKDRKLLRVRILTGLFIANLLFAIANTIPFNLRNDSNSASCGNPVESTFLMCLGQGLWLGGKFMIVIYEVYIVWVSYYTLRTGAIDIPLIYERAGHCVACLVGIIILVAWCLKCTHYINIFNENVAGNQSEQSVASNAAVSYNDLREIFLEVWLVILAVVIVSWLAMRLHLHRLLQDWEKAKRYVDNKAEENNWAYDDVEIENHRKLLLTHRIGYFEVSSPLEPYVIVFLIFSIPAVVYVTKSCTNESGGVNSVSCVEICEFVLSFRVLASAFVYLSESQIRSEICDISTMCQKSLQRLMCCPRRHVHFDPLPDVIELEAVEIDEEDAMDDKLGFSRQPGTKLAYTLFRE